MPFLMIKVLTILSLTASVRFEQLGPRHLFSPFTTSDIVELLQLQTTITVDTEDVLRSI